MINARVLTDAAAINRLLIINAVFIKDVPKAEGAKAAPQVLLSGKLEFVGFERSHIPSGVDGHGHTHRAESLGWG